MTKKIKPGATISRTDQMKLPDIDTISPIEMSETIKSVKKLANNAKEALENQDPQQMKDPKGVYKIAVDSNIWLLRAKIKQVEQVRVSYAADPKTSLCKQYEKIGLTRKSWHNYNKLSDSIVKKLESDALESWKDGECDLDKIPSQYKALKLYEQQKNEQEAANEPVIVLNDEPAPKLIIPQNHKFELFYGDSADITYANTVKQYAADNATMFIWVNGNELPAAINFIQEAGMSYQESLIWDMGNYRAAGVFTNRQHSILLIATKGTPKKPEQGFKFKSIAYFIPQKGSTMKPHYYDDVIYNMFPNIPCLELHRTGQKYNPQWFDLNDIENEGK